MPGEDPAGKRIVSHKLSRDREKGGLIEKHRAGNDRIFSAPKSVSTAYGGDGEGIKEALDAVGRMVGWRGERRSDRLRLV